MDKPGTFIHVEQASVRLHCLAQPALKIRSRHDRLRTQAHEVSATCGRLATPCKGRVARLMLATLSAEHALARYLTRFASCRILVLGDVMLDRYVLGDAVRLSPEAPIPVLQARSSHNILGGAGNAARNAATLGASAVLVGVVGDDAPAGEIDKILRRTPDLVNALVRAPARTTTVKTRFMSGTHQLLRLDEETTDPIDPAQEDEVLAAFEAALPDCGVVLISDYGKGVLTDAVLARSIAAARAAGRIVVVDPKRERFEAYAHASVLTPNALEVKRATGIACDDDDSAVAAGLAALGQARSEAVLVKRSEKGLTLVRSGQPPLTLHTHARSVADVSGAGDTLVTTFSLALACAGPMHEAAALANVAAGIVVGKSGTATTNQSELSEALHRHELLAISYKIAERDVALSRVAAWRADGLRIGFTNGCFDLIHPGHVSLLARARAQCDRLVVALNSDASVMRLKGPDRPVQHETARVTVMASIGSADLVLLFEEDTPAKLIDAIRPDLLFKGADYRPDQVIGADIVGAYGGRVELIPLEKGFSTTETIRRINSGQ